MTVTGKLENRTWKMENGKPKMETGKPRLEERALNNRNSRGLIGAGA